MQLQTKGGNIASIKRQQSGFAVK